MSTSICRRAFAGVAAVGLAMVGCESMSHTQKGALAGGGIGAGLGAAVGSLTGNAGAGAAIGGAAGTILGGVVGNDRDKEEKQQLEHQLAATQAQVARGPLTLSDIAQLAQQHVSDDIIINQIRTTGSVYSLQSNEIVWLKSQGVSDGVITVMQNTNGRPVAVVPPPRPVVIERPVVYERPVYVVPPPPRPGLGVTYIHRH